MTPIMLLDDLKKVILTCTKDLLLQVKTKQGAEKAERQLNVFLGAVPTKEGLTQDVPYILLRFLNGKDEQKQGEEEESTATVRIITAVYSEDYEKGYVDCLNVISRIRIELMKNRIVGNRYQLKLPLEYVVYEDDTGPYTIGELITNWEIPSIRQEVNKIWH